MIRQAHAYLAGAVSSVALIAAAVAVFVVLVSAQAFRDWPISGLGLGGGSDKAAVAPAKPVTSGSASATGGKASSTASGQGAASGNGRHPGAGGHPDGLGSNASGTNAPSAGNPTPGSGSGGGSEPAGAPSNSAGAGGGGSASAPSGGNGSGSGNGQGGIGETVTNTVENTVPPVESTIPGAPGKTKAAEAANEVAGALGKTGITEATQGAVNGVAGPNSSVGHAVDETVGAVGDLLHPHH